MTMKKRLSVALALVVGLAVVLVVSGRAIVAGQAGGGAVAIDNDDIGGVVTGAQGGPEAGVWVIAETRGTPTHLIRIVVTDDRGRFVVPDLPSAEYDVWVRGYGLIDSPKTKTTQESVNLRAIPAPDKKAAAQYYPAQYWLSMLQVPPKSDFPGTGDSGNGISANIRSQGEWIRQMVNTDGCTGCHQMGGAATRTIPQAF